MPMPNKRKTSQETPQGEHNYTARIWQWKEPMVDYYQIKRLLVWMMMYKLLDNQMTIISFFNFYKHWNGKNLCFSIMTDFDIFSTQKNFRTLFLSSWRKYRPFWVIWVIFVLNLKYINFNFNYCKINYN